jgi:hypothetical protein
MRTACARDIDSLGALIARSGEVEKNHTWVLQTPVQISRLQLPEDLGTCGGDRSTLCTSGPSAEALAALVLEESAGYRPAELPCHATLLDAVSRSAFHNEPTRLCGRARKRPTVGYAARLSLQTCKATVGPGRGKTETRREAPAGGCETEAFWALVTNA